MDSEIKKEYYRLYYLANKHKRNPTFYNNRNKEWRLNNVNKTLYNAAKRRARNKNLEFSIVLDDIIIPEYCPILNIKLQPNQDGTKTQSRSSPSLDRIDNTKGYTKENIQVISSQANIMKSNATKEDLLLFASWIKHTYE